MREQPPAIVFLDAQCGLCRQFASWMQKRLRVGSLPITWATWGGKKHHALKGSRPEHFPALPAEGTEPSATDRLEIFLEDHWLAGAEGILFLLNQSRPPWCWLRWPLLLLPTRWREFLYEALARSRRRFSPRCSRERGSPPLQILP